MKKLQMVSLVAVAVCTILFTGCDFKELGSLFTKGTAVFEFFTDQKTETTTAEETAAVPTPSGDTTTESTPGGGTTESTPGDDTTTESTPSGDNTTEPTPGGDNTTESTPGGDSTTEPPTNNELDNAGANTEGGYSELIKP